jgi:hypothetical protein
MSVEEFTKGRGIMSGRIAYFKSLEKTLSFEYFQYFGGFMHWWFIEPTFQYFYESHKYDLPYNEFFKLSYEIKDKPSQFLYFKLQKLATIHTIYNQPIGKLMDWTYFEIKNIEMFNMFNESEALIVNRNLLYLKKVDDLRIKLMFNIMWDIEYFYNENNKDYGWNYWIIQYEAILEELVFIIDNKNFQNLKWKHKLYINKSTLRFYDPEENIEYFNRLFNVLGIVDNLYIVVNYHVSLKFNNYNNNYVELLKIMYKYDCKRWEEPQCDCGFLSSYEIEIAYTIEDYLQTLRKEWEESIKVEKLEERNWILLKELENLMDKVY